MPGIIATLCKGKTPECLAKLKQASFYLKHSSRTLIKSANNSSFCGVIAPRTQGLPGCDVWTSEDCALLVFVNGEIYSTKNACASETPLPTCKCARLVAILWERFGQSWVKKVEGAFSVVIFDLKKQILHISNDRFGLRPLLYHHAPKHNIPFSVSNSIFAIQHLYPEQKWGLNCNALAEMLTFEHTFGDKTMFNGIKLFPPASIGELYLNSDSFKIERYWHYEDIEIDRDISFGTAVKKAGTLIKNATERLSKKTRLGVYLTSGLDSRTIAGFLSHLERPFSAYTYGIDNCRDMVWGKKLADKLQVSHKAFPLENGDWITKHATEFTRSAQGFVSFFHSHGISTYPWVSQEIDLHLSGYGGGSFCGSDNSQYLLNSDPQSTHLSKEIMSFYRNSLGNSYITKSENDKLFQYSHLASDWLERAENGFQKEFQRYQDLSPEIQGDIFTLHNRYSKMFAFMIAAEREYIEDRTPFMDYQLIDFLLSIPPKYKKERLLQIAILDEFLPEVTNIPWQVTGKNPTLINHYCPSNPNSINQPVEPGRNYPNWFRKDCADWSWNLLTTGKFLETGLICREYIQNLIARTSTSEVLPYSAQRKLTFRLGVLLSIELALRFPKANETACLPTPLEVKIPNQLKEKGMLENKRLNDALCFKQLSHLHDSELISLGECPEISPIGALLREYFKEFLKKFSHRKIALFGAGQHTIWLLPIMEAEKIYPVIIFDDFIKTQKIYNYKIDRTSNCTMYNIDLIIISNDSNHYTLYNDLLSRPELHSIEIVNPYKNLPHAPYTKT